MEMVRKELRRARYEQRLPEGIVLTGGGAKMRGIEQFVRETLAVSVKIGVPSGLKGVAEAVQKPEYAAAVGLMLLATENERHQGGERAAKKPKKAAKGGWLRKIISKF